MKYGQFNYNKVLFTLELFTAAEEKEAYLTHLNSELERVIEYFEKPKILPLRNYADSNITSLDGCVEFCDFIKLMIDKYSPSYSDRRIPSNDQLQRLVEQELFDYKKLKSIVHQLFNEVSAKQESKTQSSSPEIPTIRDPDIFY